jgi:D-alanyl-D-alanine carboxypeptidase/D-alanyl-D-alanine-endopeptidase (penicillin-binding protein 4)
MRTTIVAAVVVALVATAAALAESDIDRLHYFAVNGRGVLSSAKADEPVNPASVVKVATTLWALDRLGAGSRYTTAIGYLGSWDPSSGVLVGDLVIRGGDDPDFQWENAFLVARELNRLGLRRVEGRVLVQGRFWFGWEHGVEKRVTDPTQLAEKMGRRFIGTLDSARWTRSQLNTWKAQCARRGWDVSRRPRVEVTGRAYFSNQGDATPLLVHRSNPLEVIMRRFTVYSNNDIVRVADGLGTVDELEAFVNRRLGLAPGQIVLETASGERRNRMTVQQMAGLLTELDIETEEQGLEIQDVLPVIGCDPGSTRRMFPALAAAPLTGTVTCKTGTLTQTDGGVAVLAGTFTSPTNGPVVFAIAAPRAGGRLEYWRRIQQRWVLELISVSGGAVATPCGAPLPFSDTFAEVEAVVSGD